MQTSKELQQKLDLHTKHAFNLRNQGWQEILMLDTMKKTIYNISSIDEKPSRVMHKKYVTGG